MNVCIPIELLEEIDTLLASYEDFAPGDDVTNMRIEISNYLTGPL